MARASPPSLVILDLELGRMSGLEVCRALKSAPETGHVPVLVVSAQADAEDQRLVVQAGAHGFVTKPYAVADLIDRVGQMMATEAARKPPSR